MRTTGSPEKTAKNRPLARARVAPFFFLNHKLEKKTLGQHIPNMAAAGFDGFFLHAREGLRTPYLSEAWFDAIETCLTFAEQHNLKAWLYDEMPYPSGAAGGEVVRRHPEFIEQSLHIVSRRVRGPVDLDWEIGDGEVLAAYAKANNNPPKKVVDLLPHIGPVADTWLKVPWDSRWYYPKGLAEIFSCPRTTCVLPRNFLSVKLGPGNWELVALRIMRGGDHVEPFGQYVDVSNSDATAEFLRITHEQYRARFGKKFGTLIPGIFFDEPKFRSAQPWGRGVAKILGKISPELAFALAGKHSSTCSNELSRYRLAVDTAFKKNWLQPVKRWCARNRLQLTGHISPEEDWWFESRQTGSILKSLRQLDIPGCDLIIPAVGDLRNPVLNITASLAVSAAAQAGKKYALCEVFACSGHHLPLPQLRKISTWLACHGINFLVPHGWFYSLDGYRKYDAPPDFGPPNYDCADLRQWAEEFRKIATGPQPQADLLVVRPIHFLRGLPDRAKPTADRLLGDAARLVTNLFFSGWSWHWIDDDEIEQCAFEDGQLAFKHGRYSTLVYFKDFLMPQAEKLILSKKAAKIAMPAEEVRQRCQPRHRTVGEIFSRKQSKKTVCFNLGKTTGWVVHDGRRLRLLPGEWLDIPDSKGQHTAAVRAQLPKRYYDIFDWRLQWPKKCLYRPQSWSHSDGVTARFGSHFFTDSQQNYEFARTVFGPVPVSDGDVTPIKKTYQTTFRAEKIDDLRVCVEMGALQGGWRASLNGAELKMWKPAGDNKLVHEISPLLKTGNNRLCFEVTIKKLSHGLLEAPWLEGYFAIAADARLVQAPGDDSLTVLDRANRLALPDFEGPLCWHCILSVHMPDLSGVKIRLRRPAPDAVAVKVNGVRVSSIQGAPWCTDVGSCMKNGSNNIAFECYRSPGATASNLRPDFVLCR